MDSQTLLYWIVGIFVGSFLLDQFLSYLNLKNHHSTLPEELQGRYDAEKYAQSHAYHQTKYRFGLLRTVISTLIILGLLWFGGFGWIDAQLRTSTEHPIALPLLFFFTLGWLLIYSVYLSNFIIRLSLRKNLASIVLR